MSEGAQSRMTPPLGLYQVIPLAYKLALPRFLCDYMSAYM